MSSVSIKRIVELVGYGAVAAAILMSVPQASAQGPELKQLNEKLRAAVARLDTELASLKTAADVLIDGDSKWAMWSACMASAGPDSSLDAPMQALSSNLSEDELDSVMGHWLETVLPCYDMLEEPEATPSPSEREL